MKEKLLLPVIICSLLMTACGASDTASGFKEANSAERYDYSSDYDEYYEYYDYDDEAYETADVDQLSSSSKNPESDSGLAANSIKKEMLVYSCDISIDVLNFDEALNQFKASLDSYGGFVETENYSDGGGTSRWYYEDSEKWQSYSATVRIPSADYDDFCSAAADLGDLRKKTAVVENVSSEYYDLSTTLEIYEAKEERYIDLLAGITDDAYAVTVEKELTELQIQIAQIKTRMNEIKTDVAYSYVNISINEVKEYQTEPLQNDTFAQRLKNTLSETGSDFLIFLEDLLFLIIHIFPYLILIGIVVAAVIIIRKQIKSHKAIRNQPAPKSDNDKPENQAEQK